jgi:hypothetical protein
MIGSYVIRYGPRLVNLSVTLLRAFRIAVPVVQVLPLQCGVPILEAQCSSPAIASVSGLNSPGSPHFSYKHTKDSLMQRQRQPDLS